MQLYYIQVALANHIIYQAVKTRNTLAKYLIVTKCKAPQYIVVRRNSGKVVFTYHCT